MNSISLKKILVALLVALVVVSVSTSCFALDDIDFGSIYDDADAGDAGEGIQNVTSTVLGIAQIIGVAVAVVILVVLAVKYISAAPSEKADIKKSAVAYIIGVLLLFGGVAILNIVQNAGQELADQTSLVVYEQRV